MSDEDLKEIASHYDTMKEFVEKEWSAYVVIHRRGLAEQFCGHMKSERNGSKSDEELAEIALRYTSLKDFRKRETSTYEAICKRGLRDSLCGHMIRCKKTERYSERELSEIASRFSTLKELQQKEAVVYAVIHKRGLVEKLCGHMITERRYLSDEQLAQMASECSSRKEFMEKDAAAYGTACKRGIIEQICSHMERQGNFAKRKVYVFTFSDGYAYVGLTQNPNRRYRQHVNGERYSPVHDHIQETDATFEFNVLTDWLGVDVAGKVEDDYIKQYAAEGWKMLNKMSGGAIGSPRGGYTRKILQREVKKYQYIEDFKDGSPRFYKYIVRNHLLDELCSHMKHRK